MRAAKSRATLLGFAAILLWSTLALLTAASGTVPPFQLAAMSFSIGSAVLFAALRLQGVSAAVFRQPPRVWLVGIGGLFGYHALYFAALRAAPPAEASLVAYLWPLLIVLASSMLPGERLRWFHVAGALLGFAGASLVIGASLSSEHLLGYGLAGLAALVWTAYSLLSRRLASVPSEVVAGFTLGTALLSLLAHLLLEETVWPADTGSFAAILLLGLGPVGIAFTLWDRAVKGGDIQLVGAASYAAPILSTAILVMAGTTTASAALVLGALLVTAGASLAALPVIRAALLARLAGS